MKKIFYSFCLAVLMVLSVANIVKSETPYFGGPAMVTAVGGNVLGFNATTVFQLTSTYSATSYPAGSISYATNGSFLSGGSPALGTAGNGCHVTVVSNAWVCFAP